MKIQNKYMVSFGIFDFFFLKMDKPFFFFLNQRDKFFKNGRIFFKRTEKKNNGL